MIDVFRDVEVGPVLGGPLGTVRPLAVRMALSKKRFVIPVGAHDVGCGLGQPPCLGLAPRFVVVVGVVNADGLVAAIWELSLSESRGASRCSMVSCSSTHMPLGPQFPPPS